MQQAKDDKIRIISGTETLKQPEMIISYFLYQRKAQEATRRRFVSLLLSDGGGVQLIKL